VRTPLRVAFEAAEALAFGLLVFEDLPPTESGISIFAHSNCYSSSRKPVRSHRVPGPIVKSPCVVFLRALH